ncbi:sulfatase-like hydrolase/transferase, partial [Rickettsiaceae bacterium]|nr:sulfatase-like hydrolase/transferase [Rickettsiaceae bacterium]
MIIIAMAGVGSKGFHSHQFKYSIINYLPFNLVHAVNKYVTKHKKQLELAANKKDLTEDHKFTLSKKSDEPLTVVMVVGEAMRGDLISEEVTPLMFKRKNLVRFTYATSASTMTRVSIPYMLSSAVPPNYDQALGEKSIISIFKHLGFATSWIGSQGIFGMFETAFAPIALEADYRVIKNDLRKAFPGKIVCDECLVPFMKKRLGDEDGNQFMVLHFIGSHWNFSHRVPGSFNKRYLPSCEKDLHT